MTSGTPAVGTQSLVPTQAAEQHLFESLPAAVMTRILKLIIGDLQDTSNCSLASRRFHQFIFGDPSLANSLWQKLFSRSFPDPHISPIEGNYVEAFRSNYLLDSNLKNGLYSLEDGISLSPYRAVTADGMSFHCSILHEITVHDLKTGTRLKGIPCSGGASQRFAAGEGKVVIGKYVHLTGSFIMEIWDVKSGVREHSLPGHEEAITAIVISNGKIISGDNYGLIKKWNLKTGALELTIQGTLNPVTSLAMGSGMIVAGMKDGNIGIWSSETGALIRIFPGHLRIFPGHLGPVTFLNITNRKLISFFGPNNSLPILGKSSILGNLKIWDLEDRSNPHQIIEISVPSDPSINMAGGKILLSSRDGCTTVLNFLATNNEVLKDIAAALEIKLGGDFNRGMMRFIRLSPKIQNRIFEELYDVCKPFENDYPGCGEDAFFNRNGQTSSPAQRAEAVRAYLSKA